jgi:Undecaprenyl-phosphate glucose phosphotransferase
MFFDGFMPTAAFNSRREAQIAGDTAPGESEPLAREATPAAPVILPTPIARTIQNQADRRGPFRPGNLIPTRARLNGETVASLFRGIDAVTLAAAAWLAFDLSSPSGLMASPVVAATPIFAAAALLVCAMGVARTYALSAREGLARHMLRVSAAVAGSGEIIALLYWAAHAPEFLIHMTALWLGISFLALATLHLAWWLTVRGWRRGGRLTPTVVIVGATETAAKLIATALERRDIAVLGVFDDRRGRAPDHIGGVPILGDTSDLVGHRIMPYVDRVVITVTSQAQERIRDIVDRLRVLPNEVTLLVDIEGEPGQAAALSRLADMPLAQLSGVRIDRNRALAKRMQDLVFGAAGLVVAAPVMALIALAVRLDSPGPIFFRQRRQGFNNEEIVVWKFRSMRHEATDERAIRQVSFDDERITRVGRLIRRTSLDELPQLYNVLTGEMSLVGPRPHSPTMRTGAVESQTLVAEYAHRHRMKPGLTGWAAIHGSRGPVDTPQQVRRRVALDIEYIERQSFWLDLYVMLMTLPCLIGDRHTAR